MLPLRNVVFWGYKVITEENVGETFYLFVFVGLAVVLMGCLVVLVRSHLRLIERNRALEESVRNMGELNDRLRMDRHDYLNQLQIVYGLMELGEYDEMNAYLRKVYKDLLKTGKAIKTSKPAINALLAAKLAECDAKDIELLIEVKSNLENIGVEDWELCKVLSNLTDNAIRALEESGRDERKLRINITETPQNYLFEVENNGPKIPDEIRERIFRKGFTTKGEEGHGMGLAIVSKIVETAGGRIAFVSDDERTVFTVEFGKGG